MKTDARIGSIATTEINPPSVQSPLASAQYLNECEVIYPKNRYNRNINLFYLKAPYHESTESSSALIQDTFSKDSPQISTHASFTTEVYKEKVRIEKVRIKIIM